MSSKTNEPFWWLLFSAGGVTAAFVAPVLILLITLAAFRNTPSAATAAAPTATLTYWHVKGLLSHWLVKIALWAVVSLPLFHCFHRIRHTLEEFGLGMYKTLLAGVCYLSAIIGTLLCGMALLHI